MKLPPYKATPLLYFLLKNMQCHDLTQWENTTLDAVESFVDTVLCSFINCPSGVRAKEVIYHINPYHPVNPFVPPFIRTMCDDMSYEEKIVNGYRKRYYNREPVKGTSAFIAFFPELFFPIWELLHECEVITDSDRRFAFIDDGMSGDLGIMEAVVKYCEYHHIHEDNNYIRNFPDDNLNYELTYLNIHKNNVQYREIDDILQLKFDFIFFASTKKSPYLLSDIMTTLNSGGNAIIQISDFTFQHAEWDSAYIHILQSFRDYKLVRPRVQNPLDPTCYIILWHYTGVKPNNDTTAELYQKWRNMRNAFNAQYRHVGLDFLCKMNKTEDDDCIFDPPDVKACLKWCQDYGLLTLTELSQLGYKEDNEYITEDLLCTPRNEGIPILSALDPQDKYPFNNNKIHAVKRKLNMIKRYIDSQEQYCDNNIDLDIIDWHKLTDCIDVYRNLKKLIGWKYGADHVTNSWVRFYEVIDREGLLVGLDARTVRSFHMCELPGCWILALNHYIKTKTQVENFDWMAHSLNPQKITKQMDPSLCIDDFGLIKAHPNRWVFCSDMTGDLMNVDNCLDFQKYSKLKDIDLVTADVSLRIPNHMYNEQESFVSRLVLSQLLAVMTFLEKGKRFVFRNYLPLAEAVTVSGLYLMTLVFDNIRIVKPISSSLGSSEVFVVCFNYVGCENIPQVLFERLCNMLDNFDPNMSIFPVETIPTEFIDRLYDIVDSMANNQMRSIKRSLCMRERYYQNVLLQNEITHERERISNEWLEGIKMRTINPSDKIGEAKTTSNPRGDHPQRGGRSGPSHRGGHRGPPQRRERGGFPQRGSGRGGFKSHRQEYFPSGMRKN